MGPQTAALVEQILASRPHPEQGYRSCLGLLRLAKQYGPDRVEAASGRAVAVGARSYRHVEAMLKHGLDRVPLEADAPLFPPRPWLCREVWRVNQLYIHDDDEWHRLTLGGPSRRKPTGNGASAPKGDT